MFYFAYGSNMNLSRLTNRVGKFPRGKVAILADYKLEFNKKSSKDNFGRANITQSKNSITEGVVFNLTEEQMAKLDIDEGGYHREVVTVSTGKDYFKTITYIANENRILVGLIPSRDYLECIVSGATEHRLSESYIKELRKLLS